MELLTQPERRRRWSVEQKLAMVRESNEPGQTVSMVARSVKASSGVKGLAGGVEFGGGGS